MTSHDLTLIFVAMIGSVPALLALGLKDRRDKRRNRELHDEVKTNHGKRLGQYVEDTAAGMGTLGLILLQHTQADEEKFEALNRRLDGAGFPRQVD